MEELTNAPTRYDDILATPSTGLFMTVYERLFLALISSALACASVASASSKEFWAVCQSKSETTCSLKNSSLLSAVRRAVATAASALFTFAKAVCKAD